MRSLFARLRRLLSELQRRHVHKVAVLYAVTLFVVLQIADVTFEPLGIPTWWVAVLVVGGTAAFPLVVVMAWMFDITEKGVQQAAPGPLEEVLGRSPAIRSLAVLGTALVSVGLGWGAWEVWPGSADLSVAGAEAAADEEGLRPFDARRIAILYLDDHSEDGSLGYLAAALTEGLLHELGNVEGLSVSSRRAVKPYRYTSAPMDSIVRRLEVGSVVEGSVSGSGDRVRATIQLIDGKTLTHLDSRVVEGDLSDPFSFQDSLVRSVGRSLRQRLGRELRIRDARAGTSNVEAWTAYARGREAIENYAAFRGEDSDAALAALHRADSLFRLAEERDPEWLAPLVQRAVATGRIASVLGPLPGSLDMGWAARADSLLGVALERAPRSAEALESRGWLRARLARTPGAADPAGHIARAEADLRTALGIDEDRAGAWWILSEVLVRQGRFVEAVEAAEHAVAADAFLEVEAEALHGLYQSVLQLGPRDDALRLCNEGRKRFPLNANFVMCRFYVLGSFPQVEPDVAHARALLDSLDAASPERTRTTWLDFGQVWLARVMARAGMPDSARAVLNGVREPGRTPPSMAYDEAHIQLLLGDEAEAVRLLELSLEADPDTAFIREDWWFEDLRGYGPFRDLLGLPSREP